MVRPWRSRRKALASLTLAAAGAIVFMVVIVLAIIDMKRCHDAGGIVVAPWTRGSHCVVRDDNHEGGGSDGWSAPRMKI